MKAIKDILINNNLKVRKYQSKGNAIVLNTEDNKYIIKKKNPNIGIYEYLDHRHLNIYPPIIDENNDYIMYNYIEDNNIPEEQKMNDLINFLSIIHNKTSYYKSIDEAEYKSLYEDLSNNILYLKDYYHDIITLIDSKVYPNPAEYLLQRNISLIFLCLDYCADKIEIWYQNVKELTKMRVCLIHNNLSLNHFIQNDKNYLISWNKAKMDIPVFDLYKLYRRCGYRYDFDNLLMQYYHQMKLTNNELDLLYILINIPSKIEFNNSIYKSTISIKQEIDKLKQAFAIAKKQPLKVATKES